MLMNQPAATMRHRSPTPPQQTVDARGELQLFFKSLDAAMFDFDAEAVAAHFDLPCLLSGPEGSGSFSGRGELRTHLMRTFSQYRQQGLTSASLASLSLDAMSLDFAQSRIVWTFANARGHEVRSVAGAYTLRRSPPGSLGRWHIVHALSLAAARPRGEILTL